MNAIVNTRLILEDGIIFNGALTHENGRIVALGEAKISLFLAIERKIILLIPLILILPHFFADKLFAVFLAEPVADFLAAATTTTLFLLRFRQILRTVRSEEIGGENG